MNPAAASVLAKLKAKRRAGVTFDDFARGFRLGARIFDLREAGYRIATVNEALANGNKRARYVLAGGPQ